MIVYLPPEYKRGRSGCEDHLPKDPVSQGRSAVEISFNSILKYWLHEGDIGRAPVVQMAYLPRKAYLFCLKSDQKKKNRFEILD